MKHTLKRILSLVLLLYLFTSCDKGNDEEPQPNVDLYDILDFLTPDENEIIKQNASALYLDGSPPDISGVFRIQPIVHFDSQGGHEEGTVLSATFWHFSEIDGTSIKVSSRNVWGNNTVIQGENSFIRGMGNQFTVFTTLRRVANLSGNVAEVKFMISGTFSDNNIKGCQMSLIVTRNDAPSDGLSAPVGTVRIFKPVDATRSNATGLGS
ncbi:hypothetical protein ACFSKL_18210 [Belliella marina]|uniref:Lipoprotein n=1 Tax=Belliella marina TaxID=1644146 RepID=A0ABW4VPU5_9BACT